MLEALRGEFPGIDFTTKRCATHALEACPGRAEMLEALRGEFPRDRLHY